MNVAFLKSLSACWDAEEWTRAYDSPQEAWNACYRPDWMIWYLYRIDSPQPNLMRLLVDMANYAKAAVLVAKVAKVADVADTTVLVAKAIDAADAAEAADAAAVVVKAVITAIHRNTNTTRKEVRVKIADLIREHVPTPPKH